MLTRSTRAVFASRYGVSDDQVRLDHLLSQSILNVLALVGADIVLIGGTPLSRTFLLDGPGPACPRISTQWCPVTTKRWRMS